MRVCENSQAEEEGKTEYQIAVRVSRIGLIPTGISTQHRLCAYERVNTQKKALWEAEREGEETVTGIGCVQLSFAARGGGMSGA